MCAQQHAVVSDSLGPLVCSPPGSSISGISQAGIQEYWSGLPFPSPRALPNPGSNLGLLYWQVNSLPLGYQGSRAYIHMHKYINRKMYISTGYMFNILKLNLLIQLPHLKCFLEMDIRVTKSQ